MSICKELLTSLSHCYFNMFEVRESMLEMDNNFYSNIGKLGGKATRENALKRYYENPSYCKYCGQKFSSVASLTANPCPRHPNGFAKGKHELYEGSEKSKYTCKYCGQTFSSISSMTANPCPRHPDGFAKGKHSPAL